MKTTESSESSIALVHRRHSHAPRDPTWFLDPWRWVAYAGITALVILPLAAGLSPEVKLSVFCLAGLASLVCRTFLVVVDRESPKSATNVRGESWSSKQHEMVGYARELTSTLNLGRRCRDGVYRTGLNDVQYLALNSVLGVCVIMLIVGSSVPGTIWTVSMLAGGAAFCTIAQHITRRTLYRVKDGVLTVEIRHGWTTVCTDSIGLGGAKVRCDFAGELLSIVSDGRTIDIALSNLLNSHRFAAAVLRGAGAIENSVPIEASESATSAG